jgi:hypothetical protein
LTERHIQALVIAGDNFLTAALALRQVATICQYRNIWCSLRLTRVRGFARENADFEIFSAAK